MNITIVHYKKIQIADFPELFFGMPLNQFDEYFPTVTNLQNGIASKVSSRGSSKVLRIPLPWK